MFELVILTAAGVVLGALLPRKAKETRCSAAWQEVQIKEKNYSTYKVNVWTRCEAIVDLRCQGGNCTFHCKEEERCNGVCVNALDKILGEDLK